ncbi:protein SMAX1-LIKE 3-like [Zingiber officinale]|uniref:Clp R domain-containing protein n=1 Tax=Zingiber officinale TaxID=94328 RepID=A0A8J5G4I0_ZINOF|nr:protein SMAX1-LIKE 3-like [Zingiber officinale]KAG6495784.1 hypothetical protein ZIOFF_043612 [Zingiber officinale]
MRTGGGILQHGLTPAAAAVVGKAVFLARRRGHAQVTPLHVATAMLNAGGPLRAACLLSLSHPLRCNALDLCLNVALNRLPASHHDRLLPSLSNALVAAFKRAQAQHRRGSAAATDTSSAAPATLLAVKIELDHLVVSILDDPSVSRVMREAGFCSTQVKLNLQQSAAKTRPNSPKANRDDEIRVMEALISKERRNLVVVGECLDAIDAVVRAVIHRVQNGGDDVPEALKNAQLITLPLSSFKNTTKSNFDQKIAELRELFRDSSVRTGLVLYLGDLQSITEKNRAINGDAVEQVIMEIRSLIFNEINTRRVWLMGIATYQTYMSCKVGCPSLEALLGLHPLTIPAISLELSLNFDSGSGFNCEEEAQSINLHSNNFFNYYSVASSTLPSPWHQHYKCSSASPHDEDSSSSNSSISSFDQLPLSLLPNRQSLQSSPVSMFNKSNPNSCTSSSTMEIEYLPKFKEFNGENWKILSDALEKKLPWQQETVAEIASTVLRSRSGMVRRKGKQETTWLLFQGEDVEGKRRIAEELASLIFCSQSNFASIGLNNSRLVDVGDVHSPCKKRPRFEENESCLDRLFQSINENPHRIILIEEDIEQLDHQTQMGLKDAMEGGKLRSNCGVEVSLSDAIIILTSRKGFKHKSSGINEHEKEVNSHLSLDLHLSTVVYHDNTQDYVSFDRVGLSESVDGVFSFNFLCQDL